MRVVHKSSTSKFRIMMPAHHEGAANNACLCSDVILRRAWVSSARTSAQYVYTTLNTGSPYAIVVLSSP